MGFKRYLLWNDAVHGLADFWVNFDNYISENRFMVTNSLIWTVESLSFILIK